MSSTTSRIALALLVLAGFSPVDAHESFALRGALVLQDDGRLEDGLAVVVEDGRIQRFAPAKDAKLPNPIDLPRGSVLSPGLIDLASSIGAFGETTERSSPVTPELEALRGVGAAHEDLRVALHAGITAAMIVPSPTNIVAGSAATIRTAPAADGALDVLGAGGALVFSIGNAALRSDREPTSRPGLMLRLRSELERAREDGGEPRLRLFLDSKLDGIALCGEPADVRGALAAFRAAGRAPAIALGRAGTLAAGLALAPTLVELDRPVLLGPFEFKTTEADLRLPGELARRGVAVAFAGALPARSRHSPRITASLAVRHGMSPEAARLAITANAAKLAGVSDRLGAIAPGKDADLVVFSADPLRLDARVLRVWVRGETAFVDWENSP